VKGHPEFIWATFEHVDNAPDLPSSISPDGNDPVDSARDWTLYAKGTAAKDANKKQDLTLVEATQKLTPATPVFRRFPFGDDPDASEIKALNKSVSEQMPSTMAVWKNYFLVGAVWLRPGSAFKENMSFGDPVLAGGKRLSNTTMESFTQDDQPNCMRCHTTRKAESGPPKQLGAKRINVSHIMTVAFKRMQEVIDNALEAPRR
jgi:hypothetical protein